MPDFVPLKDMQRYLNMLGDLLLLEKGLYEGEIEFIDGLPNWEGCFTEPQAIWLEKIWDRLCGG